MPTPVGSYFGMISGLITKVGNQVVSHGLKVIKMRNTNKTATNGAVAFRLFGVDHKATSRSGKSLSQDFTLTQTGLILAPPPKRTKLYCLQTKQVGLLL